MKLKGRVSNARRPRSHPLEGGTYGWLVFWILVTLVCYGLFGRDIGCPVPPDPLSVDTVQDYTAGCVCRRWECYRDPLGSGQTCYCADWMCPS